jgi:hypothetical protein
MSKMIYFILFFIMFISLLANPAPVTVEFSDVALIILPIAVCVMIYLLDSNNMSTYSMGPIEIDLFITIIAYLMYLFFSMLIGVLNGVNFLGVLRAIGPYLNFLPLISLAFLSNKNINVLYIVIILIVIGMMQALYLFFLYYSHAGNINNTLGILLNRITLLDPHTTLPLILALIILPLTMMSHKKKWIQWSAASLVLFGLIAGAATLTRSLMIASCAGLVTFTLLYAHHHAKIAKSSFLSQLLKMSFHLLYFIPIYFLLLSIPEVHKLEQGLMARFLNHSISVMMPGTINGQLSDYTNEPLSDYSNGRLFDEWLPALSTWAHSGLIGWFFGIGAGNTFNVASGETRTYIHNLSIYSLVYGGFFGLIACMWLYINIFKTLIIRAYQTQQTIYLSVAALLISLFTYGQFFAVHKGLAFNAMLFMIITIALIQPAIEERTGPHVRD